VRPWPTPATADTTATASGSTRRSPPCSARPRVGRHPPAARALPGYPASTSTSRTRPRIPAAASSTGWRARCSCTRCATDELREGQAVVDASSGSTAISEAWFARLLGPALHRRAAGNCTAPGKLRELRRARRRVSTWSCRGRGALRAHRPVHRRGPRRLLPGPVRPGRARHRLARQQQHRRVDSRQLRREPQPQPAWIVCGAGTGGTSATIGRYLRYRGAADPAVRGRTQRRRIRPGLGDRQPATW
jgi:cysteine synthase